MGEKYSISKWISCFVHFVFLRCKSPNTPTVASEYMELDYI